MKIEILLKKIGKATTIVKAKELASTYVEGTDLNSIRKELKKYLTYKQSIDKNKIDIGFNIGFNNPNHDFEKLNEKMAVNQAYQDRVVEIHINLKKIYNRLEYIFDNAKGYIYLEYGTLMEAMTKEAKEYVLGQVFSKELEFMSDLDAALDSVNLVLRNLNNTSWMLQNLRESGEGIVTRKGVRNA